MLKHSESLLHLLSAHLMQFVIVLSKFLVLFRELFELLRLSI